MGSITKGLILRLSAAAQRHRVFAGRQHEFVAQMVHDFGSTQD
jgi:hypothetical protein